MNDKKLIIVFAKAQKKLTSSISEEGEVEQMHVLKIAYKDASLIPYISDVKEKIAHQFDIKHIEIENAYC